MIENENGVLKKVVMEFSRKDGTVLRRTLNDAQAKKWDDFTGDLCVFAELHGANPDWASIEWEEEIIGAPIKKKKKNKER